MDANKDGLMSFNEFTTGIDQVINLSQPIKEKLFAFMDVNAIGMIDYQNFLASIQTSAAEGSRINIQDNFDWEMSVIQKIK
jgi:Ca2+-binding EF-hand superfamily protein